ncbi:HalOD1 output domain-containing protein [Halomarina rubra]|uniref:HalOD1 output domain-containing protein n=1 Tax=Halomarina rubra TaxID=2071873 RepID=A0ABD6AVX6_9EURY|nr:HalOD1 output domain-containing protein [Halomarina rubra]
MEGEPSAWDTPDEDRRELRHRATVDPDRGPSLLRVVSEGLAELLDTDPESLEPPLATVAAWDALERLLDRQPDDSAPVHYVEFVYEGYVVAVHGDGRVRIYAVEE